MVTIYISLMNEGTSCWRPIQAIEIGENTFEIPLDIVVPEDEEWEFKPGARVKCRDKQFQDGTTGLIAYEAE